MNSSLPSPLARADQALLRVAARILPQAERSEWLRCWEAELWHRRHPRSGRLQSARDLYAGLLGDCLWLRTHAWREALIGTASLCLVLLNVSLLAAVVPLWGLLGGPQDISTFALTNLGRFLCEAALVTLVGFVTSSQVIEYDSRSARPVQLRLRLFLAVKLLLVVLISFVLSEDLTQPFHTAHRFAVDLIQPQIFVVMALLGLRWSFQDQGNRCKHCLRSLGAPARVGRPSWNFLESNGTELVCRDGHGLLSVPEIETSWRTSSCWIQS